MQRHVNDRAVLIRVQQLFLDERLIPPDITDYTKHLDEPVPDYLNQMEVGEIFLAPLDVPRVRAWIANVKAGDAASHGKSEITRFRFDATHDSSSCARQGPADFCPGGNVGGWYSRWNF